eukprot:gene7349-biopygen4941
MLNNAKSASLLVGHLVERFNVIPAVNQFVENVNIPYSVGALGKGCVKETLKTYSGIYIPGIIPFPAQDIVEHSDVSITFGVEMTDAVTAGFKQKFPKNTIHVNPSRWWWASSASPRSPSPRPSPSCRRSARPPRASGRTSPACPRPSSSRRTPKVRPHPHVARDSGQP